jgi:hypothetical protein
MARKTENTAAEAPESAQEVSAETVAQEATGTKRQAVQFVLAGPHQISAEVASDDDLPAPRKGGGGRQARNMEDEVQAAFHEHVRLSWQNGDGSTGRMLTLTIDPTAEREAVKRLRHAAKVAGLGMSFGNIRLDPSNENILRLPFRATTRKVYKPREK